MACLAPNKLADGTEVACRECKQCQLRAKNDWIGRNIAESKTSKFCYVITATYGRGKVGETLHERAVILTKSDVQKFMKLLRRHGFECRVFYTGEYGSERQRAHWNIVVYSQKPLPAFSGWTHAGHWRQHMSYKRAFRWVRTDAAGKPVYLQNGEPAWWWPHGAVHVDEVNVASVKYVCKYVLKDLDANGKQGAIGVSKDPPLGAVYFRQLAEKYVGQGLAPQSPEYRFPESRTREGQVVSYWLKGRSLEMFIQHYIDSWARVHGDKPRPRSEMVDLYEQYGRVVNDEQKMLVRQALPRGESRQPIPTGDQIKVGAEQARYERAAKNYETELSQWWETWVSEGSDVAERQRRQEQSDAERRRQWYAFNHHWNRHWYDKAGWELRSNRTEPCECCAASDNADHPVQGDERADSPSGVNGYGLGRVGAWNRDYGDPDAGRTGPGGPDAASRASGANAVHAATRGGPGDKADATS